MTVSIVKWGDKILGVELPTSDTYEVTYTEPGLKNAASTGQSKDATLETGAVIQVPLFVEIGDVLKVKCAEREFRWRPPRFGRRRTHTPYLARDSRAAQRPSGLLHAAQGLRHAITSSRPYRYLRTLSTRSDGS